MTTPNVVNLVSTTAFMAGLGADTHIPYTDGGYVDVANVLADLQYLGISQVRDGITNGQNGSAPLASYITLAKAGIHFTFIVEATTTADLNATLSLIDQVQAAAPGSVVAVEGANEINNYPLTYNGVGGLQGALNLQSALYNAVHADPSLAGVKVDYLTGYAAGSVAVGPDPVASGLADYDNQHPYPAVGQAPAFWVNRSTTLPNTTSTTEPAVYTETGYSSLAVDPTVQAKYTLDLVFDTAAQGISKTFLYELMDAYAPGSAQGDDGYGLYDYLKQAKPVAGALHNLAAIVGGGTGSAALTPLSYTLTGLPATGNSLVLERPDGSYVLAVWAEPPLWNATTQQEIAAPSETVTLALTQAYGGVQVYDPLSGAGAIASYSNASSVQFTLTDHPILISLSGPAGSGGGGGGGGGGAGSGPDTLVLNLSEIPAGGQDAQFTVSVDGVQQGGVQTVTALRSAGQGQDFSFSGNFGSGAHTVAVSFVNGFAGAAADAGRVLYVNAVTLDHQTAFENTADRYRSPVSYTLSTPSPAVASNAGSQDSLVLNLSEQNPNGGDVQFMVSVDGQVVGGVRTISAQQSAGQSQNLTLSGNFGAGTHTIGVDYLNGFSGDPADSGRVLNVNSITLDGATTVVNSAQRYTGLQTYAVTAGSGGGSAPPSGPSVAIATQTLTADTGPSATDGITNDGRITLSGSASGASGLLVQILDGTTVLGNATLNGAGGWTFATTLGVGTHALHALASDSSGLSAATAAEPTVVVDATAPTLSIGAPVQAAGSTQVSLAGAVTDALATTVQIFNGATSLGAASVSNGSWSFSSALPAGTYTFKAVATDLAGNTANASDAAFTVVQPASGGGGTGSGADTLVLNLSEVPASGQDAQFTVSVDGQQVGGTQTVTALRSAGQGQDFTFQGNFGAGAHTVAVTFVNGFAGAAADVGRVLYVNAVTLDHQTSFENTADRYRGAVSYSLQTPSPAVASNAGTQDTLVLNLSEQNPNGGDVQFMVAVDGQVVGGVNTVTAQQGAGQSQSITLTGNFGPGAHSVSIDYLNGFSGDPADVGRVLDVNSITLDGATTALNAAQRYTGVQVYQVQSGWIV